MSKNREAGGVALGRRQPDSGRYCMSLSQAGDLFSLFIYFQSSPQGLCQENMEQDPVPSFVSLGGSSIASSRAGLSLLVSLRGHRYHKCSLLYCAWKKKKKEMYEYKM